MRDKIAQYMALCPRNKLIFTPRLDSALKSVDVGYELAKAIEPSLSSNLLSMIAEDEVKAIFRKHTYSDEVIGDYLALTNWGILFEPSLKLNIVALFDSFSKNQNLILVNCGQADNACFHLVSKHFNTSFPMGQLSPYIIQ